jgi:hypothetical protein
MNFLEYHKLSLNDPILQEVIKNPHWLGLTETDLKDKNPQQRAELIVGEYFLQLSRKTGELASQLLFKSQWGYQEPEWFDHRHHLLSLDRFFGDYWAIPPSDVVSCLPWGGSLLELCSGDGFYPYYFYRNRAKEIVCVEFDEEVYRHAKRCHDSPNIDYVLESVLEYQPSASYFDVVSIRGAIEHFNEDEQLLIFKKAYQALKSGGWFCGDTPAANPNPSQKHLSHHEHEYKDETELKEQLSKIFDVVHTYKVVSKDRINLFWKCQKTAINSQIPTPVYQEADHHTIF